MFYEAKIRFTRRFLFFLFISLCAVTLIHPQQFHSLEGIESTNGQTRLVYRLGLDQNHSNPIFKLNVQTGYKQQIMDAHGIYFYQLKACEFVETKKMLLIK